MTIEITSTSEEGFVTTSQVGEFELTIDATDEEGPNPNATLLADYASCFVPAFRVGGQQRGHDDLGRIGIDVEGDLDDDEDLEAIRFHLQVEKALDEETAEEIVARAEELCHVHAALREELHADVTVEAGS